PAGLGTARDERNWDTCRTIRRHLKFPTVFPRTPPDGSLIFGASVAMCRPDLISGCFNGVSMNSIGTELSGCHRPRLVSQAPGRSAAFFCTCDAAPPRYQQTRPPGLDAFLHRLPVCLEFAVQRRGSDMAGNILGIAGVAIVPCGRPALMLVDVERCS